MSEPLEKKQKIENSNDESIVRVPLSRQDLKLRDGTVCTHMRINKKRWLSMLQQLFGAPVDKESEDMTKTERERWKLWEAKSEEERIKTKPKVNAKQGKEMVDEKDEKGRKILDKNGKKKRKRAGNGIFQACEIYVNRGAVGVFKFLRGKMALVHTLLLLDSGVIDEVFYKNHYGKRNGSCNGDHQNEDPSDNRDRNLRLVRHEMNCMRQGDFESGISEHGHQLQFQRPMFTYIERKFKTTMSQELKDLGYKKSMKCIPVPNEDDEIHGPAHYDAAKAAKSAAGLAVLRFLLANEPEIFNIKRIDAAGNPVNDSIYAELKSAYTYED